MNNTKSKITPKEITEVSNILLRMSQHYESCHKETGECKELGSKALELIGDYPLYAATSNITYSEAIAIASVLFGDIDEAYKRNARG